MPWNIFWPLLLQAFITMAVIGIPISLWRFTLRAAQPKQQPGPVGPMGPAGPPGMQGPMGPVGPAFPGYPGTGTFPNTGTGPWISN